MRVNAVKKGPGHQKISQSKIERILIRGGRGREGEGEVSRENIKRAGKRTNRAGRLFYRLQKLKE